MRRTCKTDVLEVFLGQCYQSLQKKNHFCISLKTKEDYSSCQMEKNFVITLASDDLAVHCQKTSHHFFHQSGATFKPTELA